MNFEESLGKVLSKPLILAEAVRRSQKAKILAESSTHQEGSYYWIPTPDGKWELMSWYASEYGQDNTDHVRVWKLSAAPYLAELWGVPESQLQRLPYGLPRGRVSIGYGSVFINHGDDSPVPQPEAMQMICREFGLGKLLRAKPDKVKWSYDNHERTQRAEKSKMDALLQRTSVGV